MEVNLVAKYPALSVTHVAEDPAIAVNLVAKYKAIAVTLVTEDLAMAVTIAEDLAMAVTIAEDLAMSVILVAEDPAMSVTLVAEDPAMVVMMCEGFRVLTLRTDHVAGHTAGYCSCINNQGHVRVHSLVKTDLTKLYFGQPLSVEQRANPVTSFGQSRDLFRSDRDYCTKDGSFGFW